MFYRVKGLELRTYRLPTIEFGALLFVFFFSGGVVDR